MHKHVIHKYVHWLSWYQLVKQNRGGVLGFRDMHMFNQALLARQGWRLIHKLDSLCSRVLKSEHYPRVDILYMVISLYASPAWS